MILLLLGIQTNSAKKYILQLGVKQLAPMIHGHITIEQLSGNFFSHIHLSNIQITQDDSLVLGLQRLDLHYTLKSLLGKRIVIDTLQLTAPYLNLKQDNDSTWNITSLFKTKEKSESSGGSVFPFTILLHHFQLNNGQLLVQTNSGFKGGLRDLNLFLHGRYKANGIELHTTHLSLLNIQPELEIKNCSFDFEQENQQLRLSKFKLTSRYSSILAEGEYLDSINIQSRFVAQPLHKDEVHVFLPDLELQQSPTIQMEAKVSNDTLTTQLILGNDQEQITITGSLHSLNHGIRQELAPSPFALNIQTKEFNVTNWLTQIDFPLVIRGEIKVSGESFSPNQTPFNLHADLSGSQAFQFSPSLLTMGGTWSPEKSILHLMLKSEESALQINSQVNKSLSLHPSYEAHLKASDIQLHKFIPQLDSTAINLNGRITGTGFNTDQLYVQTKLSMHESIIQQIPVDSIYLVATLKEGIAKLDTMTLIVPGAEGHLIGKYNLSSKHLDASTRLRLDNLNAIKKMGSWPIEMNSSRIAGRVSGHVDSLHFKSTTTIQKLLYDSLQIGETWADINGNFTSSGLTLEYSGALKQISYSHFELDTLSLQGHYQDKSLTGKLYTCLHDSLEARLETKIRLKDTLSINIPHLSLKTHLYNIYNASANPLIELDDGLIRIQDFQLADSLDTAFLLRLEGQLSKTAPLNMALDIQDLHIHRLGQFIQFPISFNGTLNSDWRMTGSADAPSLVGNYVIQDFSTEYLDALNIEGRSVFRDQQLTNQLTISSPNKDSIFASVNLPLFIHLTGDSVQVQLPENLQGQVYSNHINLTNLMQNQVEGVDLEGSLHFDIRANGNIQDPTIEGFLNLSNGRLSYPGQGIEIDDALARIQTKNNQIVIDTFHVKRENGYMDLKGTLDFDSSMVKGLSLIHI
jgi:hypothetical protein